MVYVLVWSVCGLSMCVVYVRVWPLYVCGQCTCVVSLSLWVICMLCSSGGLCWLLIPHLSFVLHMLQNQNKLLTQHTLPAVGKISQFEVAERTTADDVKSIDITQHVILAQCFFIAA